MINNKKLLTILFMLLILTISIPCRGLDLPVDIYMTYINFDWDHDHNTNDAIDIRINYTNDYDYPEWKPSVGNHSPFAYCLQHDEPIIKAKFECSEEELVWKIDVEGDIQSGHDIMESIDGQIEFPGYGYIYIVVGNLTLEDTFTHVDFDEDLYWSFDIVRWYTPQGTPYDIDYHICTTDNYKLDCYTLLDVPDVPFYYSGDAMYSESCGRMEPWTENMLHYVCNWASGKSNATNAMIDITESAYYELLDVYHIYMQSNPTPPLHSTICYKLLFYFNETLSTTRFNCLTSAELVHVFSRAVGINSYMMNISQTDTSLLRTNLIKCFRTNWASYDWPQHRVVFFNDRVFDPTAKANQNDPFVPVNLDTNTYKQVLLQTGYNWVITSTTIQIQALKDTFQ